jgi:hypothetical protein
MKNLGVHTYIIVTRSVACIRTEILLSILFLLLEIKFSIVLSMKQIGRTNCMVIILGLTKYRAMKTYWGSGDIAVLIF